MIDLELVLALAPLIVGAVAAIRRAGLPTRFAPLASVAVGVLIVSLAYGALDGPKTLSGIAAGLTACGLYSGAKASLSPT